MKADVSMPGRHDELIRDLVGDLVPVRRLFPPAVQAAAWCGLALALGAMAWALLHRTEDSRPPFTLSLGACAWIG